MLLGAIETGGTTTRVAIGRADGTLEERAHFPTRAPAETVERAAGFLRGHRIAALGVAAFGPIDVERNSPRYGTLLDSPKKEWSRYPLRDQLRHALGMRELPIVVESDVNAAALAEQRAATRAGIEARVLAYVTVGTGIGVGVAIDGRAHHGALHPEAGHLRVTRAQGDGFAGVCPFHGDCLEGLASAPAIAARAGVEASQLAAARLRDEIWRFEAEYLASLLIAIVGLLAPQQVVFGGGVMKSPGLIDRLRERAATLSNGYSPLLAGGRTSQLVVAPRLGDDSGLAGALQLATS